MHSDMEFYRGKRVFVTGHTGFKGTWLCRMLVMLGADVTGFALKPPTDPSIYALTDTDRKIHSVIGDIRDKEALQKAFYEARPEAVFHLAAQPIVLESYRDPRGTYETNVMGTVNLMECIRENLSSEKTVKSVLNVTTDKVYQNREWCWGYREEEPLDGYDPYSNSKSCSELVTHSYRSSFFHDRNGQILVPVSTARAGNVIGGGDFAADRIIPDSVRAAAKGQPVTLRNPHSTRPYQHVLEPLYAYLMIAARQAREPALEGAYNVGPDECDCRTTGELEDLFVSCWGENLTWINGWKGGMPHEAAFLKLDCSKLKSTFGWKPCWHLDTAVKKVVEWSRCYLAGEDVSACTDEQIREYLRMVR